jgi:hypothetical protein
MQSTLQMDASVDPICNDDFPLRWYVYLRICVFRSDDRQVIESLAFT